MAAVIGDNEVIVPRDYTAGTITAFETKFPEKLQNKVTHCECKSGHTAIWTITILKLHLHSVPKKSLNRLWMVSTKD